VKVEVAALSVYAQRCQSHYFSATPCTDQRIQGVEKIRAQTSWGDGGTKTKMCCQGTICVRCILAAALWTVKLGLTKVENQAKPLEYCHLWPVQLCDSFLHYLINGTIFEKKVIEYKMCVLIFCTTFVWNISHLKVWARYDKNCVLVLMHSSCYAW
jgi:hypothetical protein